MKKNSDGDQLIGGEDGPSVIVQNDQAIEAVVGREAAIKDAIALEAFMNEMVTVEIADTTDENLASSFLLNVNGRNLPMVRGVPLQIRRLYLEVLARCKETKYRQEIDPIHLDKTTMVPRTAYAYPFQVTADSPKGRAWLKAVMAEPA